MIATEEAIALYCPILRELMVESGRVFLVPEQIASTVNPQNPEMRFVKAWAVMHRLIPAHGLITVQEPLISEVA